MVSNSPEQRFSLGGEVYHCRQACLSCFNQKNKQQQQKTIHFLPSLSFFPTCANPKFTTIQKSPLPKGLGRLRHDRAAGLESVGLSVITEQNTWCLIRKSPGWVYASLKKVRSTTVLLLVKYGLLNPQQSSRWIFCKKSNAGKEGRITPKWHVKEKEITLMSKYTHMWQGRQISQGGSHTGNRITELPYHTISKWEETAHIIYSISLFYIWVNSGTMKLSSLAKISWLLNDQIKIHKNLFFLTPFQRLRQRVPMAVEQSWLG